MDWKRNYRQFMVAIIANISTISVGATFGWTSPSVPKLRNLNLDENPIGKIPTDIEESWIGSLLPLGALIAPFVAGPLNDIIGRKWTLMSSSFFMALSSILLVFGRNIGMVYAARFIQGCGVGVANTALSIYVGEIATVEYRGALGSFMQLFVTIGFLYVYCIGPYVSYVALQWLLFTISAIFVVLFFFMPESPNFYMFKNRKQDATRTLRYLRIGADDSSIENELAEIQLDINYARENKGSYKELFANRGNVKGLVIVCALMFFVQTGGIDVVLFNSQTIFERTGSDMKPEVATIVVGLIQFFSSASTLLFVEKIGRKLLLLISLSGMVIAVGAMGIYFYLDSINSTALNSLMWLPVTSLVVFVALFNIGMGPIPWALVGELFSVNIKSYAATIATVACWVTSFVMIYSFEFLNKALGIYWSFWIFSIASALAFLFTLFYIFETRGLTVQEIQNKLNKRK